MDFGIDFSGIDLSGIDLGSIDIPALLVAIGDIPGVTTPALQATVPPYASPAPTPVEDPYGLFEAIYNATPAELDAFNRTVGEAAQAAMAPVVATPTATPTPVAPASASSLEPTIPQFTPEQQAAIDKAVGEAAQGAMKDVVPTPTPAPTPAPEPTIPQFTPGEQAVIDKQVGEDAAKNIAGVPAFSSPDSPPPVGSGGTSTPETTIPETVIPETTTPVATTPEPTPTIPETTPETTLPVTTTPVTTTPETTTPGPIKTGYDLQKALDGLGLGFLYEFMVDLITDPNVDVSNADDVARYIEASTDKNIREAIRLRFIGNEGRVAAGLPPLKPNEYIAAEQSYITRLRSNGMPRGFYDQQSDLAKLIGGGVSADEFDNRLRMGYKAAQAAPDAVKTQLQTLYGITDSDLAAYFLDPTRATDVIGRYKNADLFAQQIKASEISAQAKTQADIQLGLVSAENLGKEGITGAQAREGFSEISAQKQIYTPLTETEQAISQEEQIGAAFGTSAAARQAVARRKRTRIASFEAGGGFASAQGASSLGTVGQ